MVDTTKTDKNNSKHIERLAVAVSGIDTEKILGIPKLNSGTGALISNAVFELVIDWGLSDNIVALSFDTTASNTG